MIAKTLPGEVAPDYKAVDPFEDYAAKLDFNFAGRQRETPRRHLDDRTREELRDRAADIVRSFRGDPTGRRVIAASCDGAGMDRSR